MEASFGLLVKIWLFIRIVTTVNDTTLNYIDIDKFVTLGVTNAQLCLHPQG